MSFSSIVKDSLSKIEIGSKCCMISELLGIFIASGVTDFESKNVIVYINTENSSFARRVFNIAKKLFNHEIDVSTKRNIKFKKMLNYTIAIHINDEIKNLIKLNFDISTAFKKNCCKKSFLRGIFLACGSITNPEKYYHLELILSSENYMNFVFDLLIKLELKAKVINRKKHRIIYLKESENILDFLNIIGAHSALLELENIRIFKDMRNNVNRIVNCETANLEKTVNASVRQVNSILYIKNSIGLNDLNEQLREIAEIRLSNTDANLKELGEMLTPKIGKSGVNHRLKKIEDIAENLKKERGDLK